jgi:Fuc2NAc and GlcNAc transferase
MTPSLIVAATLALSTAATGAVYAYAKRRLVDQVNERSSHAAPTPRGGGLGLTIALLAVWLWTSWADVSSTPLLLAVGALAGVAALGWWDDHANLPARLRLGLQFLFAGLDAALALQVADPGRAAVGMVAHQ